MQRSFWSVVELLVTGIAFGLIGLQLRGVVVAAGAEIGSDAAARAGRGRVSCSRCGPCGWSVRWCRRVPGPTTPTRRPRTGREAVVLAWCGMRGLATLALALSIPTLLRDRIAVPRPRRDRRDRRAPCCSSTLLLPGFTLAGPRPPARGRGRRRRRGASGAGDHATRPGGRGRASSRSSAPRRRLSSPACWRAASRGSVRCCAANRRPRRTGSGSPTLQKARERAGPACRREALAAARAEVLAARREPGVDPEAADRVLNRLDLRTVLARLIRRGRALTGGGRPAPP